MCVRALSRRQYAGKAHLLRKKRPQALAKLRRVGQCNDAELDTYQKLLLVFPKRCTPPLPSPPAPPFVLSPLLRTHARRWSAVRAQEVSATTDCEEARRRALRRDRV